jgi:hypothetical protein
MHAHGSARIREGAESPGELVTPGALEVELDPRERVLVRVGAISGAELSDLAEDGGSVPSARLEVSEPASLMPISSESSSTASAMSSRTSSS